MFEYGHQKVHRRGFFMLLRLVLKKKENNIFETKKLKKMNTSRRLNKSATHTHPFNGPLSETTRVSRYENGKTSLDFTEARDNEWQWHQLGHTQVCTSFQTDNHARTPPLSFFTGRMPFLPPNQQRQSTEGNKYICYVIEYLVGGRVRSQAVSVSFQPASSHCIVLTDIMSGNLCPP